MRQTYSGDSLCWAIAAAFLVVGCGPTTVTTRPPAPGPAPTGEATEVLRLVNQERQGAGLSALAASPALNQAAQDYAQLMAEHNDLSHTLGSSFGERVATWHVRYGVATFGAAGENIAEGQPTPATVVKAWMGDVPHRANILGRYTFTGVGAIHDSRGRVWWCQDFVSARSGELKPAGGVRQP